MKPESRDKVEARTALAKKVQKGYEYLTDSLPMEAWFWEIIRRTTAYRDFCDKIEDGENEQYRFLMEEIGILPDFIDDLGNVKQDHYIVKELLRCKSNKTWYVLFPKPALKYSDFDPTGTPRIAGVTPFQCATYEDLRTHFEDALISVQDPETTLDEKLQTVLDCITSTLPEDTIYIGISKRAGIDDIEKKLKLTLKRYLNLNQKRPAIKKWKYYLIAYDLRKFLGSSYPDIADILSNVFQSESSDKLHPLRLINEDNVKAYLREAEHLIDFNKYRKYLYLKG